MVLRGLLDKLEPRLSTRKRQEGEGTEEYAHRLASHLVAMRLMERVDAGCSEFSSEVQALRAEQGGREATEP
jgi:hypothetical protein